MLMKMMRTVGLVDSCFKSQHLVELLCKTKVKSEHQLKRMRRFSIVMSVDDGLNASFF